MINYAGSISQLANNELQMDQSQRAAMERMLARLVEQHQNQAQMQRTDRALNQRDVAQAEDVRQYNDRAGRDITKDARLTGQFNQEMQLRRDELGSRAADRASESDWRQKVFTTGEQDKQLRMLLPVAEDMANQGQFETTEDVIKHFPSLAPQAPMLSSRSMAARRAMEESFANDQQDAQLLNEAPGEINRYSNMVKQERDKSWNGDNNHWYRPNQPDQNAIDEWTQQAGTIRSAADAVTRDRSRMGRLTPDAGGRYSPAQSLPWRSSVPGVQAPGGAPSVQLNPQQLQMKLGEAYQAMKAGANPEAVRARMLQKYGIDINAYRE